MIAPQQPRKLALHDNFARIIDLRFVGSVGRIEPNPAIFTAQVFEGGFLAANQSNHDFSVARRISATNQSVITVQNSRIEAEK